MGAARAWYFLVGVTHHQCGLRACVAEPRRTIQKRERDRDSVRRFLFGAPVTSDPSPDGEGDLCSNATLTEWDGAGFSWKWRGPKTLVLS